MNDTRPSVYWQGLIAGLIGYATVAIVIALGNVVLGRSPFHTAALLGQTMFYGLEDPALLAIGPGPVFAFNGFHLIVFLALGMFAAWLAKLSERGPHFWYIGAIAMFSVGFHLFGAYLFVNDQIRSVLSPWALLGAGFAAMIAMSGYLVAVHPKLREEFRDFAALDEDLADTKT